jgi:hypothetical protein
MEHMLQLEQHAATGATFCGVARTATRATFCGVVNIARTATGQQEYHSAVL